MEYLDFLNQIKTAVQEKTAPGTEVAVNRVIKNNRHDVETLMIMAEGTNMSPTIYLREYYEKYQKGTSIDALAEEILQVYQNHMKKGKIDFSFFTDYEQVKDYIACRLVNYEKNQEILPRIPHRRFLDLTIVYYYRVDHEQIGKGSILIQNTHLKLWGITEKTLYDIALANTVRLLPYELISISELLSDLFGFKNVEVEISDLTMYVLTNTEKYFGAVNMIYDTVLEAIAERIHSDFYVLPSSVHECMIVPVAEWLSGESLQEMVSSINKEHVAEEEILGDTVYRYDRENKLLIVEEKRKSP